MSKVQNCCFQPGDEQEVEQEQRIDTPSNSQSGEYLEETNLPEDINPEPEGGSCNNEKLRTVVEVSISVCLCLLKFLVFPSSSSPERKRLPDCVPA